MTRLEKLKTLWQETKKPTFMATILLLGFVMPGPTRWALLWILLWSYEARLDASHKTTQALVAWMEIHGEVDRLRHEQTLRLAEPDREVASGYPNVGN